MSACQQITTPVPLGAPRMRGVSYTSFGVSDFGAGYDRAALADAKAQLQCDYVALNVFVYQSTAQSTSIGPTFQTSTDDDIRKGVSDARRNGMRVFLKVNVDLLQGSWRGTIVPDNEGAWFASYSAMMIRYAVLAESLNIEMFSVGCELVGATQPRYDSQWRELISAVRGRYSGKLVYCANWDGIADINSGRPEYLQVNFWDALDYLGVDVYPALAESADEIPSASTAAQRVAGLASLIRQRASMYGKNVILTESGLASVRGALAAPWNSQLINDPNAQHDEASQALFYSTMISVFGTQPWCEGIFWWNWEAVESPNAYQNFSPRNKLAAQVVKNWYSMPI